MVKIILIGDASTGKSMISRRIAGLNFTEVYNPTIGVDFKIKTLHIDDTVMKFQIWDTAGLGKYRVMPSTYYKGAAAVIVVFSYNDPQSYASVKNWMQEVGAENEDNSIVKILVGNKSDCMTDNRQAMSIEAEQLASRYNMRFIEVSARENVNITELFMLTGREIIAQCINAE